MKKARHKGLNYSLAYQLLSIQDPRYESLLIGCHYIANTARLLLSLKSTLRACAATLRTSGDIINAHANTHTAMINQEEVDYEVNLQSISQWEEKENVRE